ncbi:MAG: cobaltochelatase CobT-related protein [Candidatus Helarchaeota archaeon]
MSTEDPLIGPASISELKKTIAICTQMHQTNLQIIPSGAYTDGSTIYISPPPADLELLERWIILEALTIHESWHILFQSDFNLLRDFVTKYESEWKAKIAFIGKIAHDVVNIVEDARIEYLGKKRFVGVRHSVLFNNVYWLKKRPTFARMQEWEAFIEGLLQLGVCNGLKEPINNNKVEKVLKAANFYLHWAMPHEIPGVTFLAAEKIMNLLLKYFKIEGNYSQQILAPPNHIVFEPQESSSERSFKPIPELPRELQEELEEIFKEREEKEQTNRKEGTTGQKKEEDNLNQTGDKGSCSEDRGQSEGQDVVEVEIEQDTHREGDGKGGEEYARQPDSNGALEGEEESEGTKPAHDNSESIMKSQSKEGGDTIKPCGSKDNIASAGTKTQKKEKQDERESDSGSAGKFNENQKSKSGNPAITEGQSEPSNGQPADQPFEDDTTQTLENEPPTIKEDEIQELSVVNITEIDPVKTGALNLTELRIKIDDIVKRNYTLLKDIELIKKAQAIVKALIQKQIYKNVFYTKTFDIGLEIEVTSTPQSDKKFTHIYNSIRSLIQITINQFKALFKSGAHPTSKLKFGRLDSRKMIRGLVNEDPHIFKKNILDKGKNEIAIALLIDQSGSMHGRKIVNAQKAAILFGEVLNALDLNFSIYGWTDIEFYDTALIDYFKKSKFSVAPWTPFDFPPEINSEVLTMYCYKEFNDKYEVCKKKLGQISAQCDNSDHNAIEFMTEILLRTKKRVKILMVLSDGQPNARSYEYICCRHGRGGSNRWNIGNLGINLTRQAIENAQKFGIQTLCISIDNATNYQEQIYGQNNYIVVNPKKIEELPVKIAKLLSLILRRAGVKF